MSLLGACNLFDSSGSNTRDYVISVESNKSLPIDSIQAKVIVDSDTTYYSFSREQLNRTPIDSLSEKISATLQLTGDKSDSTVVEYQCYSDGVPIIDKATHFEFGGGELTHSGGRDSLLVEYVTEYNSKKLSYDMIQNDSAQMEAVWLQNRETLKEITVRYMLDNDSSTRNVYAAFKNHSLHTYLMDSTVADTLGLYSAVRDSLISREVNVDSVFAQLLAPGGDVAQLLAEIPNPIEKILPDEPIARFRFSGTITSHANEVALVYLHIWGDSIIDTIVRPMLYDAALGEYNGYLDLFELGERYTVSAHVYDADSLLTGFISKVFDISTFDVTLAGIDGWNAKPFVSIDSLPSYSIGDVVEVSFHAKDTLGSQSNLSIWVSHGTLDYTLVQDFKHMIFLPAIDTVGYSIKAKAIDSDGNISYTTRNINILKDVPVVELGEKFIVGKLNIVEYKVSIEQQFGAIVNQYWDFNGDGVIDDTLSGNGISNYHFTKSGLYTSWLFVKDDDGNIGKDSVTVTVINQPPLISSMQIDTVVLLGSSMSATCNVSDEDGVITHYEWDFDGNGIFEYQQATNTSIEYLFKHPGTHTVFLKITDDEGLIAIDSVEVKVNSAPYINQGLTDTVTVMEDEEVQFGLSASDFNGDVINWSILDSTDNGLILLNNIIQDSLIILYRPSENFEGLDSLSVIAIDVYGATDTINLYVSVKAINDFPTINGIPEISGNVEFEHILTAISNCSDIEDSNTQLQYVWYVDDDKNSFDGDSIGVGADIILPAISVEKYLYFKVSCIDSENGIDSTYSSYSGEVTSKKLIIEIDTDSSDAGLDVRIPLNGNVDVVIDWGDGNNEVGISASLYSHTYSSEGKYMVTISGNVEHLGCNELSDYFNNLCVSDNLIKVYSFGQIGLNSLGWAFVGSNITTVPKILPETVTNLSGAFKNASKFNESIMWDTKNVTDISWTFSGAWIFNSNINHWDVRNVTNMKGAFSGARNFNQDLNDWETLKVVNMGWMFSSAISFNGDISKWNVGEVTEMLYMFENATSFNRDLNNWDVLNVLDMAAMFSYASSFDGDLSKWQVKNVINMNSMFRDATLFSGDIIEWDVSNISKNLVYFLYGTSISLETYSEILIEWAKLPLQSNITLDMGELNYHSSAIEARKKITEDFGWDIDDGGLEP